LRRRAVTLWVATAAVDFAVAVHRRTFAPRSLAALGLVMGACIACAPASPTGD